MLRVWGKEEVDVERNKRITTVSAILLLPSKPLFIISYTERDGVTSGEKGYKMFCKTYAIRILVPVKYMYM